MTFEGYEVWLIIALVIGVIASNIAVLKYSAKFKMPQFGDSKDKKIVSADKDGEDKKSTDTSATVTESTKTHSTENEDNKS